MDDQASIEKIANHDARIKIIEDELKPLRKLVHDHNGTIRQLHVASRNFEKTTDRMGVAIGDLKINMGELRIGMLESISDLKETINSLNYFKYKLMGAMIAIGFIVTPFVNAAIKSVFG